MLTRTEQRVRDILDSAADKNGRIDNPVDLVVEGLNITSRAHARRYITSLAGYGHYRLERHTNQTITAIHQTN